MILPRPNGPFEWRDMDAGPALVCVPLADIASHLFTSRHWELGTRRDDTNDAWTQLAAAFGMGARSLTRLRQVHGRRAVVAERNEPDPPADLPPADIVLTADMERVVAVQAADCVPMLLADRKLGAVAAVHAGWRGLAAGAPGAAVEAMAGTFGSEPGDLVAAIGPSVGACCYEVGAEVREAFVSSAFGVSALERWFMRDAAPTAENPSMPGVPVQRRPGHFFFDAWSSATDQLIAAGVPATQIACARLCTASHPTVFCSYRREGAAAGRIAAAIRPSLRR